MNSCVRAISQQHNEPKYSLSRYLFRWDGRKHQKKMQYLHFYHPTEGILCAVCSNRILCDPCLALLSQLYSFWTTCLDIVSSEKIEVQGCLHIPDKDAIVVFWVDEDSIRTMVRIILDEIIKHYLFFLKLTINNVVLHPIFLQATLHIFERAVFLKHLESP